MVEKYMKFIICLFGVLHQCGFISSTVIYRCMGSNLIWSSITTSVAYIDVTTGGIAELAGDWATFSWARHCFSQPLVDV